MSELIVNSAIAYRTTNFDCGPYGFICEPNNKVRLCEGDNIIGPAFLCPPNTVCNEDSSDVCENTVNYIDPGFNKAVRCHRNERIADPSVPGCKGYILCIPNKSRFQGIKFKCSGNTIFNGFTRTCSAPTKYRCPLLNSTKNGLELFNENRRIDTYQGNLKNRNSENPAQKPKPIECRNYKFSVTQDSVPVKATYFCPSRPVVGENSVRCTIFSNQFCITLERDSEDQFLHRTGVAYRKPRM
ncbi:uncharacterized protein LOC114248828 [Bombyx mandarina]|uniref:Uncharacterized protein LOC114248828 n=1 Tax=Bombyx mandarina TaxID=7092 RepID=A0A6J2K6W3_BOMMA|nr:uncharacterized protein LOC114248828 [Bombyx mandarina]